jgi:hypothetical protein
MAVGGIGAYRQCAVAAQQIDCLMEDSCLDGWNGVRILRVVLRVDYRVVIVESKRIPHGKRWQDLMIPYCQNVHQKPFIRDLLSSGLDQNGLIGVNLTRDHHEVNETSTKYCKEQNIHSMSSTSAPSQPPTPTLLTKPIHLHMF